MAWIRSNKKGSGGGGGIPAKYLYSFTKEKEWIESGIGSSSWLDDTGTTAMNNSGSYKATAGEYLTADGNTAYYFPISSSYYAFGIRCEIPSTFTPAQSNDWFDCSCILGREMPGTQKDYAVIISKNGKFALGWSTASITESSVNAIDGEAHDLIVIALSDRILLYIDGNLEVKQPITMGGYDMDNMGVFNNVRNGGSRTTGKIYRVAYWSYTEPTGEIIEETIPKL